MPQHRNVFELMFFNESLDISRHALVCMWCRVRRRAVVPKVEGVDWSGGQGAVEGFAE